MNTPKAPCSAAIAISQMMPLLPSVYDGQPGDTAMTCEYAKQSGIPVVRIPPVKQ